MSNKTTETPVQEDALAKARAEAEAILAKAEEEAKAIREQAEEEAAEMRKDAAAAKSINVETAKEDEPAHNESEEYVDVQLFKDNDRYKDDVLVCVNGETCQIKRGVRVKIKKKFLWAIQNQMRQDSNTANMIQELHEDFERSTREHRV